MKTIQRPLLVAITGVVVACITTISWAQEVGKTAASTDVSADAAMAEDLAVMSKILEARVGQLYGAGDKLALWVHHDETWPQIADELGDSQLAAPLANYLDGYGAVLQMELPGVRPELPEAGEQPAAKPASVWEQVRGRLRGEAAKEVVNAQHANACTQCHTASAVPVLGKVPTLGRLFHSNKHPWNVPSREELSAALLDVLAENGHNFRQLKSQERLTIAVTIRPWRHKQIGVESALDTFDNWLHAEQRNHNWWASVDSPSGQEYPSTGETEAAKADAGNHELTGDLHARQGRTDDALHAYQKALEKVQASVGPLVADDLKQRKRDDYIPSVSRLYEKLAATYEQAGQTDEADKYRGFLTQMTGAYVQATPNFDVRRYFIDVYGVLPPASSTSTKPARLTISATKSLLDQIAAGKITREQFKASAVIRYMAP